MKRVFCTFGLLVLFAFSLQAQDISGDWQGMMNTGKDHLRVILHIDKVDDGASRATLFSIDEDPAGIPVTSITQRGAKVMFSIAALKLSDKGTVSSSGESIVGRMTQGEAESFTFLRPIRKTAWPRDIHCLCAVSFVSVESGVKLEVLDWGGAGHPLILLAGLGDSAHVFDKFAAKLIGRYHVYGITRRGFGDSSAPPAAGASYSADRLGDDVLAVIDALHLPQRPVLVGHSIAGEELSSIGSRHPEKVAGLVYLDAAYSYAFYNPARGDVDLDALEAGKHLEEVAAGADDPKAIAEILEKLPELEKELRGEQQRVAELPRDPSDPAGDVGPAHAILLGQQKYTEINAPVLAIFANPHALGPMPQYDDAGRAAVAKDMSDFTSAHVNAFQAGVPSAHVVNIPNAEHYVFQSNEADVLREMNAFIGKLPN